MLTESFRSRLLPLLGGALIVTGASNAAVIAQTQRAVPIDQPAKLEPRGVSVANAEYKGRKALKVTQGAGENFVVVKDTMMRDGTIEVDVAGTVAAGAGEGARGFIGIAYRVNADGSKFENFYIRPTNGRAEDQLRRNHSTQYTSMSEWPWDRLRKEFPGKYESYVDLEAGAWTAIKAVISGPNAKFYVNNAPQPCLIVTDMKLEPIDGNVALWIGAGTEGYFSNLRITPAKAAGSK